MEEQFGRGNDGYLKVEKAEDREVKGSLPGRRDRQ